MISSVRFYNGRFKHTIWLFWCRQHALEEDDTRDALLTQLLRHIVQDDNSQHQVALLRMLLEHAMPDARHIIMRLGDSGTETRRSAALATIFIA